MNAQTTIDFRPGIAATYTPHSRQSGTSQRGAAGGTALAARDDAVAKTWDLTVEEVNSFGSGDPRAAVVSGSGRLGEARRSIPSSH